jgi:hypothetical protein
MFTTFVWLSIPSIREARAFILLPPKAGKRSQNDT